MTLQRYQYNQRFELENGQSLSQIEIAYHTYGTLNADKSNVVWVCHALTANADVVDWWPGVVGDGCVINPNEHFIVCANILGSCYGTTGPLSISPETGESYYHSFPQVTVRDMVKAHMLLREHLGINKIRILAGGSMGGYQVLEWAVMEPEAINKLFLLATSAAESAWGIAIHATQRLAIEADSTWLQNAPDAGAKGLKTARGIGILTYRNYETMVRLQTDTDVEKLDDFKAASYINYQGDKLVKRFNAYSYWILSKAMDSHNLARKRADDSNTVLQQIQQPALLIGIASDMLCPVAEQRKIAEYMPNCTYIEIDSTYGHDGFLIESVKISEHLRSWLSVGK